MFKKLLPIVIVAGIILVSAFGEFSEKPTVQMQDYQVVSSSSIGRLTQDVNNQMSWGNWQPLGGVAFDGTYYLQAMVK
jgi:hypothetical protein